MYKLLYIADCSNKSNLLSSIQTWLTLFANESLLTHSFPLLSSPPLSFGIHHRSIFLLRSSFSFFFVIKVETSRRVANPFLVSTHAAQTLRHSLKCRSLGNPEPCTTGNSVESFVWLTIKRPILPFFSPLPSPSNSLLTISVLCRTLCVVWRSGSSLWSFCRLLNGRRDGFQSSSFLRFVRPGRPGGFSEPVDRLMKRWVGVYLDWLGNCFRVLAGLKRNFRRALFSSFSRGNFMSVWGIGAANGLKRRIHANMCAPNEEFIQMCTHFVI